jgi:hypothetical protein
MKRFIYIFLFLSVASGLVSCERLVMPKKKSARPTEIFDEVWRTINNGYALFDYKGINWDSVQFDYMLRISDTLNERELYDSLAIMVNILQDPMVSLDAGFSKSYYNKPYTYKENFNRQLLENKYWAGAERTGPLLYKVIDSVGYIFYGDFDQQVTEAQINSIVERMKELGSKKGIILDVRNSIGSNTDNMYTMFNHMGYDTSGYDYSIYLFQTAYRIGTAKDEFTDWTGTFIDKNDKKKLGKKLWVLTNRRMYGVPSLFAAGSSSFFNVRTMGDTTGGGAGLTSSFELSNGWRITYTSSRIRMSDGTDMIDGVAPDTTVHLTSADEAAGKDTMIEAALANLLK